MRARTHRSDYGSAYQPTTGRLRRPRRTISFISMITADANVLMRGRRQPRAGLPDAIASLAPISAFTGGEVSEDLLLRGLASWGTLLGTISLEIFGHLHNVVEEDPALRDAFFDHQMHQTAASMGLA